MSPPSAIRHSVLWVFMGSSGGQVISFAVGIVLARLLAPEVFGMLLTMQVLTGLAGFVAGGGMGQALIRAQTASHDDYRLVFTLQLMIGVVIYTVFFSVAPWVAASYDEPLYADMLRVMALSFLIRPFTNVPASLLTRQMRFKALTLVSFVSLIASSTVSVALAWQGYGVWALILGGFVGPVITIPSYMLLARWRPGFSLRFGRARELARYGLLVSANDLVNYLREQSTVFILSRSLGPAAVGLYNKGESLARMPHTFISGSVYQVLFRALAAHQDNLDTNRYLFQRSLALVALYATPFYVGFLWLAEPLVVGLYGEKWAHAAAPLTILALAWPFWLMANLSGAVLAAQNWLHRELPVQIAGLTLRVLAILWLLPHGLEGVAWAITGISVYFGLHLHLLALRAIHAPYSLFLRAILPAALLNGLLALVLGGLTLALPPDLPPLLKVLIFGGTGGIAYIAAFFLVPLSQFAEERVRWLRKLGLDKGSP